MVVCLARGLAEAGHRVSLLAAPGSQVPEATLVPVDPVEARRPDFAIAPHLPKGMDLLLSYVQVRRPPDAPWIHRLEGNRKPGESSPPNTIYLSESHARRHGEPHWVYNGVDPRDFRFAGRKTTRPLPGTPPSGQGLSPRGGGRERTSRRLLLAADRGPAWSLGPVHRQVGGDRKGGAAGGGAGALDAGAVGRALRRHHPGGAGERHAGIGHSARVAPRDHLSRGRSAGRQRGRAGRRYGRRWTGSTRTPAAPGSSVSSPIK